MVPYVLPKAEGKYSRHQTIASKSKEKGNQETDGNGGKEEGKHKYILKQELEVLEANLALLFPLRVAPVVRSQSCHLISRCGPL
jgi:hypothetical protein